MKFEAELEIDNRGVVMVSSRVVGNQYGTWLVVVYREVGTLKLIEARYRVEGNRHIHGARQGRGREPRFRPAPTWLTGTNDKEPA